MRLRRERTRDGVGAALLCLLVVAFTWRIGVGGRVLAGGDVFSYFYPYWAEATRAIRALRLPGWNPYLFTGVPLVANSQVGFFYPLNWPLWLLFPPHRAVHVSMVVHLCLAAVTAYVWGRRGLRLGRPGAWAVGAAFALGGYMSAQLEHVNQLQGLAWLPLMLTLAGDMGGPRETWRGSETRHATDRTPLLTRRRVKAAAALALVIGLVLLAGHTQTAFITVLGTGVYAVLPGLLRLFRRGGARPLAGVGLLLVAAALLGAGLAAVQLIPTWELSRLSVRAGGLPLNERVSFSLSPLHLGRALLPVFGNAVPPDHLEHVAYVGSIGIVLAVLGMTGGARRSSGDGTAGLERDRPRSGARDYVLLVMGVAFALGLYNPLYVLLARYVPGFAHFRVPARWLALYALIAAGLIGRGCHAVAAGWELRRGQVLGSAGGLLLLVALAASGEWLERGTVDWINVAGWGAAGALGLLMVHTVARRLPTLGAMVLLGLVVGELWLAGEALPQARATAAQAFTSVRPAMAHLMASEPNGEGPRERVLSLSDTTFEPGDSALIDLIYGPQLSDEQLYEYIVATKQKEILSPNLPLAFQIPAVDGYDGGVLPLSGYVALQRAFLSPDEVSMDGRLRENLRGIPHGRWLSLLNVRYIITDKLRDAWVDDVFYDLQFGARLSDREAVSVAEVPDFEATGLSIVSYVEGLGGEVNGASVGRVEIGFADGTIRSYELGAGEDVLREPGAGEAPEAAQVSWQDPAVPLTITLRAASSGPTWVVRGLSLVDQRTGSFHPLVVSDQGRFRLAHSGDVKIYENLDVLPRAFVVSRARTVEDDEAALEVLRVPTTDLASEVVLSGDGDDCRPLNPSVEERVGVSRAVIRAYDAERVVVEVELEGPGYLLVTDAYYPGWRAEVDGEPAMICRANLVYRAVRLEGGEHHVVLTFHSVVQQWGIAVTLAAAAGLGVLLRYQKTLSDT